MGKNNWGINDEINREIAEKEGFIYIISTLKSIVSQTKVIEYRLITAPLLTLNTSLQTSVTKNVMTMN